MGADRPAGIEGIVLAAGRASRFGAPKLLAPIAGVPLIRRTVERLLASVLGEMVVVLGQDSDDVREALRGLPLRFTLNARYADGLSSSLVAGLEALSPRAGAAVIALGDQPAVLPSVVDDLVDAWRRLRKPIVAPLYSGEHGNPVLFERSVFGELRTLTGDRGARDVVERDPARVARIAFDFPAPRDIDTEQDLADFLRELPN